MSKVLKRLINRYLGQGLVYYPNIKCKCTCGGRIPIRLTHIKRGIPQYVKGHNRLCLHGYRHQPESTCDKISQTLSRKIKNGTITTAFCKGNTCGSLRKHKYSNLGMHYKKRR